MPATHRYQDEFYDYIEVGARRSAARVVNLLYQELRPKSILDLGCGRGIWLAEWLSAGIKECIGVDGDYVDTNHLRVPRQCFAACDLSEKIDLGRKFDLVQSLEVAEHIDK